eukprot:4397215-Amphidinium_carterae.1
MTKVKKVELRGRSRLSLTALSHGITGVRWASCWLQLRDIVGLPPWDEWPLLLVRIAAGPCSSTHSCKASTLSWACKYGLSEATRALLGYHRSSVSRMVDLYGRDHQAPALHEVAGSKEHQRQGVLP